VFPAVRPDVVLMDLNLGNNTSGVDATRAIATALPSDQGACPFDQRRAQQRVGGREGGRIGVPGDSCAWSLKGQPRARSRKLVLSHRTVENHVQSTLCELSCTTESSGRATRLEHGLDDE
jgi:hypothetical protein